MQKNKKVKFGEAVMQSAPFTLRSTNSPLFKQVGSSPVKKMPYYTVSEDGTRTEVDFDTFKEEANKTGNVDVTGNARVDLWQASIMGGKTGVDAVDQASDDVKKQHYEDAVKKNKEEQVEHYKKPKGWRRRRGKSIFGF